MPSLHVRHGMQRARRSRNTPPTRAERTPRKRSSSPPPPPPLTATATTSKSRRNTHDHTNNQSIAFTSQQLQQRLTTYSKVQEDTPTTLTLTRQRGKKERAAAPKNSHARPVCVGGHMVQLQGRVAGEEDPCGAVVEAEDKPAVA